MKAKGSCRPVSGPKQAGGRNGLLATQRERWEAGGAQCPEKKLMKRVCSVETETGREGCPFPPVTAQLLTAHTGLQGLGEKKEMQEDTQPFFSLCKFQPDLGTRGPWVVAMRGCSLRSYC